MINPPAPITLSLFDKVLLSVAPAYGRSRIINKMGVANAFKAGYITPGSQKPSMRSWRVSSNTVEGDTLPPLGSLRAGSRDMFHNTPIAVAILKRMQTNVIGFGLRMQSRVDFAALGITQEKAEEWQRNTEREWRYWCETTECDARRSFNFYDLQSLAFISELMSGDCFVFLPYIKRKGCLYDLRVKIVEADFICNPPSMMDTYNTAGGITVDEEGAPVTYHLKTFPKDMPMVSYSYTSFAKWIEIPAYGSKSGRKNVLHLFRADRPGQRRGVPFLAPVLEPLKNITRLTESELQAAVIASFFTVFVKNIPTGLPNSGFIPSDQIVGESDKEKSVLYEMGPGSIVSLQDNEDITIADPKRPNAAFEPFFLAICKQIGAAVEIPYEQILLCYNSSYSAARGAVLEAWKSYKTHRGRVANTLCQPVYEAWLVEAITRGRIKAPGFLENPMIAHAWSNAKWTGPGQGMINPQTEVAASAALIDAGLSTHEEEYSERTGGDWESAARTLSRERKLKETLGIKSEKLTQTEVQAEATSSHNTSSSGGTKE